MPCRELGEISLTSLMGQPVEFRPKQVLDFWKFYYRLIQRKVRTLRHIQTLSVR